MIDNFSREQIMILINQLENIQSEIDIICSSYDNMISNMNHNLLIDNKIMESSIIYTGKKELEGIDKEISSGIIPRIHNLY